jgi:hypothetical protein
MKRVPDVTLIGVAGLAGLRSNVRVAPELSVEVP